MMKCIYQYHLSGQNFAVEMLLSDLNFNLSIGKGLYCNTLSLTSHFSFLHRYYDFSFILNESR